MQTVLTAAQAGQRGLSARETLSHLHTLLDPGPLRIRLRQMMSQGGLAIVLGSGQSRRPLGVLRVTPTLMTGPQGTVVASGTDGVDVRLSDEAQLWLLQENTTAWTMLATGTGSVQLTAGGLLPAGSHTTSTGTHVPPPALSGTVQVTATLNSNRETSVRRIWYDHSGERIAWAPQPANLHVRGVYWTVRYEPTVYSTFSTRPAFTHFFVEDGASVLVPRETHPMRVLASAPSLRPLTIAAESPAAAASSVPRQPSTESTALQRNGFVLPLGAFGDETVAALGEHVLEAALELLQERGSRHLTPRRVADAMVTSLLDQGVREGLAMQSLPTVLPQAMSGGVAFPLGPVRRGGQIKTGYLTVAARMVGRPRPVGRLEAGDAELQRQFHRITLVYETEIEVDLRLLTGNRPSQWAAVLGAPLPTARWVAGWLGRAVGWRGPDAGLPVAQPGLAKVFRGSRTVTTTVRMAVPEPLAWHRLREVKVTPVDAGTAALLRRSAALPVGSKPVCEPVPVTEEQGLGPMAWAGRAPTGSVKMG